MLEHILIFIAGFIFLVKGSEYFVQSAANIAKRIGVSELLIGLTLVSFGTSIPELASSLVAAMENETALVIGNVVGSNIANIGLIIGLSATLYSIKTKPDLLHRDGYIMASISLLFYLLLIDQVVTRIEASVFLLLYFAYVIYLFETQEDEQEMYHFRRFLVYFFGFRYAVALKNGARTLWQKIKHFAHLRNGNGNGKEKPLAWDWDLTQNITLLVLGGVAVILGAYYVVEEAIFIAEFFQIPHNVIGLTLIALGTSLPEVSVSIVAASKGFGDIAVGNVLGSNIANILLICGTSALISPLEVPEMTLMISAPMMLGMCALLMFFIRTAWRIRRIEGFLLLVSYIACMTIFFL